MTAKEHQELNCWIAEHVMGWTWSLTGPDPYEDGYCWFNSEGKFPCDLPSYTTDSAAALEVLKACQDKTKTANILLFRSASANHPCIGLEGDDDDGLMVESETLELAIAIFAKKLFSK